MTIQSADLRKCPTCNRWGGIRRRGTEAGTVALEEGKERGPCVDGPWHGSLRGPRNACGQWLQWVGLSAPVIEAGVPPTAAEDGVTTPAPAQSGAEDALAAPPSSVPPSTTAPARTIASPGGSTRHPPSPEAAMDIAPLLARLDVPKEYLASGRLTVRSPITGGEIAHLAITTPAAATAAVERAHTAFLAWREVPPPQRGELVRTYGQLLRAHKADLGELISIESGKIREEGLGEVQEMIDICDFAAGLSRQLYGLTIASERRGHRLMEVWHPAGVVGVVSAFNFPAAVWAWNAALAWVCGDSVVWKPSERTPLTALACAGLFREACDECGVSADGLLEVLVGGKDLAGLLADDRRVAVLSATGSCAMGRALAPRVAARLGRSILELGGNNGAVVCPSADLDLTERAVLFAAVGTAGQRCTTLRRLFVHDAIHDELVARLQAAWQHVPVGDPLAAGTLVGPLIDASAWQAMAAALVQAREDGGRVWAGERLAISDCVDAYYVRPALVTMPAQTEVVKRETFAPVLYVMRYRELDEAIALHNAVPQGLASSIFTRDLVEAERFMAAQGSDCGIVNVNTGPSGAEIGGAFGGEKDTGGGRESGSDAWKAYMRRATCTINYSGALPLAQGIRFGSSGASHEEPR